MCVSNVDERLLVCVSRGEREEIERVSGGRERIERMRTQVFGSVEINSFSLTSKPIGHLSTSEPKYDKAIYRLGIHDFYDF